MKKFITLTKPNR